MSERLQNVASQQNESLAVKNAAYQKSLNGKRTARHASEESFDSPEQSAVIDATRFIRNDLNQPFAGTTPPREELVYQKEGETLTEIKDRYWRRASQVGTEHGAQYGVFENYLKVGPGRSYEAIKHKIEAEYPEDSIPRSVLDGIDAYHNVLQINPALAATITMELIGGRLGYIEARANDLEISDDLSPQQATRKAFAEYINTDVPAHIAAVSKKYGTGDKAIRPYVNKASFYPAGEEFTKDVAFTLSTDDAKGMIEAYDIQSRPYNDQELRLGNEIAQQKEMQAAMIRVQEEMVEFSRQYLDQHPERATGNLKNFSEIFVLGGNGELLPNPKLLRAMVNNVLPAVATVLLERASSLDSLTADDITEGVRIASKDHKLFQTNIGQFNHYSAKNQTVELHSVYKVVCPANSLFPKFLTEKLGTYYEEAKTQNLS